jgi:16S rRNA (guanine(966)-N(2))-methyltransferase RsmD
MRVIAGTAKRLPLKTPKGMDTRPTQDRIKETLFNMIQNDIPRCTFLDLFAGSGGIGIEALSRGAKQAYFVEKTKSTCSIITENLKFTHLEENATVINQDIFVALNKLKMKGVIFDIIFMDPPYNQGYEYKVLDSLKDSALISSTTLLIVEASLETDCSYLSEMGYELLKEKTYKTNKHLFIKKA